jgi:hypothetical protein
VSRVVSGSDVIAVVTSDTGAVVIACAPSVGVVISTAVVSSTAVASCVVMIKSDVVTVTKDAGVRFFVVSGVCVDISLSDVPTFGKVVNDDGDVSADVTRNDDAAVVVTEGDEVTCNDVDAVKPDDEAELVGAGTFNTLFPVLFLDGGVGVICTPPT